jgi:hypothetical protein
VPQVDVVEAIARDQTDYWLSHEGPPAFRVADLHSPTGAEQADDPAAAVLRAFAADPGGAMDIPATGWRVLARTRREVLFGCEEDGEHYLVRVQQARNGSWERGTSSYFFESHQATRDGNPASRWRLDAASHPTPPNGTELHVLVTECHCASGRSAEGRIESPDVFYTDDEVRIVAYVTELRGPQRCPGNPATPAIFVLPEPVAERRLVDAGEYRLSG